MSKNVPAYNFSADCTYAQFALLVKYVSCLTYCNLCYVLHNLECDIIYHSSRGE
jgi:hypothetical protein